MYDNEDSVCGIEYNGTAYFFIKNLQGDIIAIANSSGEIVARYTYDAWGVCTIVEDETDCGIATINPFRYRGYYYDTETNLYYLQSRYYDPVVGRFINADEADIPTIISILHSNNLFYYCCNNPTNETDSSGYSPIKLIGKFLLWAFFGGLVQLFSDIIENLYKKFIKKINKPFKRSPLGDYLGSALSWGMCSLKLFDNKLAAFLAPFLPVVVKHTTNIIRNTFSWHSFLLDLAAAFVAGFISVALNNSLKNKLKKLKAGKGNRYSDYQKYLKKQQKIRLKIDKSFLKASITIVIATSLMSLFLNLLIQ